MLSLSAGMSAGVPYKAVISLFQPAMYCWLDILKTAMVQPDDRTNTCKKNITPKKKSVDLYAKRETIYTRAFTGIFRNIRIVSGLFLFAVFFRHCMAAMGERQAVWWNLPERKFYIFGATFWPQDFMLLSWLLIICAFGLFFLLPFLQDAFGAVIPAHKASGRGSLCGAKRSLKVTATPA